MRICLILSVIRFGILNRILFICLLLGWFVSASAQPTERDRLRRLLSTTEGAERISILDRLCRLSQRDFDLSLRYARQLLTLTQAKNPSPELANAYGWMAEVYALHGQPDSARKYLLEALRIAEKQPRTPIWYMTHERWGQVELTENNNEPAIEQFLTVLPYWEKKRNSFRAPSTEEENAPAIGIINEGLEGEMRISAYLGEAYTRMGQYEEADKYLKRALESAQKAGMADDVVHIRFLKANLYVLNRDYPRALAWYQTTLNYAREEKDQELEARVMYHLSEVHAKMKDISTALKYSFEGLMILKPMNLPLRKCESLLNLARIYLQNGQPTQADTTAREALAMAQSIKSGTNIMEAYLILSEKSEKVGETRLAYQYFQGYIQLKEGTSDQKALDKVHRLQQQYENEKIRRELELQEKERELADSRFMEQQVGIYSLLAGLLILLGIAGVIYSRVQTHRKNNQLQEQQIEWINVQNQALLDAQKELNETLIKLTEQKAILTDKNQKIEESFEYARLIQEALLPLPNAIKTVPHFIFCRFQETVSGDFYWFASSHDETTIYGAVADGIGSGVAPALLSLAGFQQLNMGLKTQDRPVDQVLERCHRQLGLILPNASNATPQGMEMGIFKLKGRHLTFSGALLPLILFRAKDQKTELLPASNMLLGNGEKPAFPVWERDLNIGDRIYLFTDGFCLGWEDTVSIERAINRMQDFLAEYGYLPFSEQFRMLNQQFGNQKLADDVIVLGFEVR